MDYDILYETDYETVVAKYEDKRTGNKSYQSEKELEIELIENLKKLGYEYINIKNEKELIDNFKNQLERLNNYKFENDEWNIFFKKEIQKEGVLEKAKIIHNDDCITTTINNKGISKNIKLIDKSNIHENKLQVINQYREEKGTYKSRYDVTILINGLPLIHIELKRRGVALEQAFNQITRYQRNSFWAGSSLFEFVQIFVISNGTHTKYYSNTTRLNSANHHKKTNNTFEFTIFFADAENRRITDLVNFTNYFFARHTILNILTKYCVLTEDNNLLVMRPYQIVACERILNKIKYAENKNIYGKIEAGGYIWHTTGSGKTLTSFKTSLLASKTDYIDKVLFVVDRKDLDYQTIKEYEKYKKGCVSSNKSTKILQEQIENDNKIIVTTIQKLSTFIKKNKVHNIYNKKVVIIFDECHRSQFGEMHTNITKHFKKYAIFGFTGTPIFKENASNINKLQGKTTPQVFGNKLHTYTIVDAIHDETVLPFKVEYHNTFKNKDEIEDKKVPAINKEEVFLYEKRLTNIAAYILQNFDIKTKRNSLYALSGKRVNGFNSILAVSSIEAAIKYYNIFKKLNTGSELLRIATIFSFNPNEEENGYIDDESIDTENLDVGSREFLDSAIADYNNIFNTSFDTSSEKFENYYKDISQRMKNKEIDLLIVVNMFLTGFDAKTLNTLWVDKNLKYHSLIQAFSRTNRILNSVKTFGNIICFRNLVKDVENAIALFGNKDAENIVLLKSFNSYFYGYDENGEHVFGYIDYLNKLYDKYPLNSEIITEQDIKEFIKLFGVILKFRNILSTFEEFIVNDPFIKENKERDLQDYQSIYIDLYSTFVKKEESEKESILDDIVFEIELIKQVEVNIDYILKLVMQYLLNNKKDEELSVKIYKTIDSTIQLRNKKELIEQFINSTHIESEEDGYIRWQNYIENEKEKEITNIINEEKLKEEETKTFINNAFRDGEIKTSGVDFDKLLPPISRFSKTENRQEKKNKIAEKLTSFFEKFFNIS